MGSARSLLSGTTLACVCVIAALVGWPVIATASNEPARVQRLLAVAQAIGREYGEAFDRDHVIVRPMELDEAQVLLAELRQGAPELGPRVAGALTRVEALVSGRADVNAVRLAIDELRTTIRADTGVDESILPPEPPSPAFGKRVYDRHCVSCHGPDGKGDGPDAATLKRRPADFTDPGFMRRESPLDFFVIVTVGRHQSAMPAWQETLSVQERWDVVSYLWSLHIPRNVMEAGGREFIERCASCHAPAAAPVQHGEGQSHALDFERVSGDSDEQLHELISGNRSGGQSHRFAETSSDEQRWALVVALRSLTLGLAPSRDADGEHSRTNAALRRVRALLGGAVDAYRLRDPSATALAAASYLEFEPIESALALRDPRLVTAVEERFTRLQRVLAQADAAREVDRTSRELERLLGHIDATGTAGAPDIRWLAAGATALAAVAAVVLRRQRPR